MNLKDFKQIAWNSTPIIALVFAVWAIGILLVVSWMTGNFMHFLLMAFLACLGAVAFYPAFKQYLAIQRRVLDENKAPEKVDEKPKQVTSRICVLIEKGWKYPPEHILAHVFGHESIRYDGGRLVSGESAYLVGPVTDIQDWILSVGGTVWTSTNPMVGNWTRYTLERSDDEKV